MNKKPKFHKDFKLNGIKFSSIRSLLLYVKENERESHVFLKYWFNNEDFVIVQTSGSTGKPKQIKLLKKYMINSAIATGNYFNLKENTTALLCLSPNYIAGKMMLVRALVLGWDLTVILPTSNPLSENEQTYDFAAMVPMQVHHSLDDLHKVKQLIVGGGIVSKSLLAKLQSLKTKIFATYGMTETVTHIAIKKLNNCVVEGSNFETLPNVNISLDNRNCLVIDAPEISNQQIITNDLVDIVSKNSFKWLGRFDNIINSGGVKIIPEQVEEKLTKIIQQPFFITSLKDEVLGEKLILVIEGKIIQHIETNIKNLISLSKFEIPKEIFFIDKFLRTKTEKIDRSRTLNFLGNKN